MSIDRRSPAVKVKILEKLAVGASPHHQNHRIVALVFYHHFHCLAFLELPVEYFDGLSRFQGVD